MKKVLILGVGAQGAAAAQRLDEEPNVGEILCADRDEEAIADIVSKLKKGKGTKVDAHDRSSIVAAARGCDLLLNALPLECTVNVMEAALEAKCNYQDYAASTAFAEDWIDSVRIQYEQYGPRFAAIDRLALVGTGSAPGLICCATRDAMRYLDTCDTIYNIVWEGVEAKRFQPFWWSPVTALQDMSEPALIFEDGKHAFVDAFSLPIKRQYDYMDQEITFREHNHDEPLHYGFNAEQYFKGVKNVHFKYAGCGMDFAEMLNRAGLLSHEKEDVDGQQIAPFDLILRHLPAPPKYKEEIRQILDEGLVSDSGCMTIEAYGTRDGENVLVETHVFAPGLAESFERAGITAEMYITGQGGYLFSKMMLNGELDQKGLISSDMLTLDQVKRYFDHAGDLGITLRTEVKPWDKK